MDIKRTVLERMASLYFSLDRGELCQECEWISSVAIADHFGMDDTQVRKDLALIGVKGRPRMGFKRKEIFEAINNILGLNKPNQAIVVGAGRLGGALSEYPGFRKFGLKVTALFDNDPGKVGKLVGNCPVYSMDELESEIEKNQVKLAVLTCPINVAQDATNRMVKAGVKAIWNFSPCGLSVPEGVIVRNEHISVGLVSLTHFLNS